MNDDKLSQEEIDALINSFQVGGEDALQTKVNKKEEYRRYDFNRPEKFSLGNLQSIERIAIHFAKNLSQTLTAKLRLPFTVEYTGIEQMPFVTDYADIMTKDYYGFFVTDLGNQDMNEIVLELDLAFIIAVHRRWLGNELPKELGKRKPLSLIEQLTAQKLLETVIYENLNLAFNSLGEVDASFVAYQTDSQLLKITSATDMIALVSLRVSCKYWDTTMRLVLPFESLESVIDKLTAENVLEFTPNKKKKTYKEEIQKGLENVLEDVYVSVGDTQMTLKELSELEIGDVLRFESKITEPVKGFAGGVHKFNGLIGKNGIRKSFQFIEYATETVDTSSEE